MQFVLLYLHTVTQFEPVFDLKPYDVKKMIEIDNSPVSLQLEGSHVGRGAKWQVYYICTELYRTDFIGNISEKYRADFICYALSLFCAFEAIW